MTQTLTLAILFAIPAWTHAQSDLVPAEVPQALIESSLTVIHEGESPRAKLRYRPELGAETTFTLRMELNEATEMSGMPLPPKIYPTVTLTLRNTVAEIRGDGSISQIRIIDAQSEDRENTNPMITDALRGGLLGVKNASALVDLSDQGMGSEVKFETNVDQNNPAASSLLQSLQPILLHMVAPLPDEAVGVGGKWMVKSTVFQAGMVIEQEATYTLVSSEDGALVIDLAIEQDAKMQKVEFPSMPEGAEITLISLAASAAGAMRADLAHLFPSSTELETTAEYELSINQAGVSQSFKEKVDARYEVVRVED